MDDKMWWPDFLQARLIAILAMKCDGKTNSEIMTTLNLQDEMHVNMILLANS